MKNGSQINCLNCGDQGILTPPSELIESLETDAELVLVIEKEAVFRSLAMLHLWDMPTGEDQDVITISSGGEVSVGNERVMNDKVEDSNNSNYYTAATATAASTTTTTAKTSKTIKKCILITGKGYPDIATRQLLVRLSQLKKPRQQQQHSSSLCSKLSSTSSSPSSSSSQPLALDTLPIPEPSSSSLISSSFPYLSSPFIASRSANNDSASIAVSENYHHHTAMCSPLKSMLVFDDHHDSMNSIDLPVDDGVPDVLFDLKEEIEILGENYEDKQLFHMETDDDIGWIVDNQVEEKYQPEDEVQEDNLHLEEVHLVFTPDDCSVEAGLSLLTDLHADTVLVQEEEIEMDLEEMFLMGSGRARQQYDHVNSSRRHDHLPDDGEIELDMSECFASTLSSPNIAGVLEFDYQVPTFDILQEELFEMKTLDQILPDLGCYGGGGRYESYSNNNNDINMFRCLKNTTEDESIGFKIDPLHEHDGFPSEDAMVMEEEVELHLILEDATSADEDGYSGEQQQQQVVNLRNTQQPAEHQSLQVHQVPQQNSILNICALVDCDPHGFEIFLTYAHGSKVIIFLFFFLENLNAYLGELSKLM